jgi:hypothetical protein|tara:strand:+ start:1131 stop:1412 length:282 start_codon:yes stop_codon:yes gene_type:complete
MISKQDQQDIDLVLCIAMFRCFNEQLYTLVGKDSKMAKKKFNRLIKVAKMYDDEIIRNGNHDDDIDVIYDKLMDIIIEMKELIIKEYDFETTP